MNQRIADNLKRIRGNIADACTRKGRNPEDVHLVAVTKNVEMDTVRFLLESGQLDLGESRVQQLLQRQAMIDESISRQRELSVDNTIQRPRWHMIGHLQRNKVKQLLPAVALIHSVDSLRLAEEINTAAARLGLFHKVHILLQVNTSQEKQKTGLAVGAVTALAEQIETLPNIRIAGLMTMTPLNASEDVAQFCFGRCREVFDELCGERIVGPYCKHLSMGMSQDYVTAVQEGSTMVRVGSALFE